MVLLGTVVSACSSKPMWISKPSSHEFGPQYLTVVGTASLKDVSVDKARNWAIDQARKELAAQIEVEVKSTQNSYIDEEVRDSDDGVQWQSNSKYWSSVRTHVNTVLTGGEVLTVYEDGKTDTIYVLYGIDLQALRERTKDWIGRMQKDILPAMLEFEASLNDSNSNLQQILQMATNLWTLDSQPPLEAWIVRVLDPKFIPNGLFEPVRPKVSGLISKLGAGKRPKAKVQVKGEQVEMIIDNLPLAATWQISYQPSAGIPAQAQPNEEGHVIFTIPGWVSPGGSIEIKVTPLVPENTVVSVRDLFTEAMRYDLIADYNAGVQPTVAVKVINVNTGCMQNHIEQTTRALEKCYMRRGWKVVESSNTKTDARYKAELSCTPLQRKVKMGTSMYTQRMLLLGKLVSKHGTGDPIKVRAVESARNTETAKQAAVETIAANACQN